MFIRLKFSLSVAGYVFVCWHCLWHHGAHDALPHAQIRHVVRSVAPPRAMPLAMPRVVPVVDAGAVSVVTAQTDAAVAPDAARAAVDEPQPPGTASALQAAIDAVMARHAIAFVAHGDVIDARSHDQLDAVASLLRHSPTARLEVQGHTDNVGNPEANRDMSARRAASVARYLAGHGISLRRMRVMGFGDTRPVAENTTSEGRLRNRRVSFRVLRGP